MKNNPEIQVPKLYNRLKNNDEKLLNFLFKVHQVAFESEYRDLQTMGTSEYLANKMPEVEAFFKEE